MKFAVATMLTAMTAVVSAVTSSTGVFNISSPVDGQTYVIGQILPCTWQILPNIDPSGITLNINLVSAAAGSNVSIAIQQGADMSKTNPMQQGNDTYYEHSVNYAIPSTVLGGNYNVIFDANGAQTKIPITIQTSMTTSSAKPSGTGASASSSSGSIFNAAARPSLDLATKTVGALTIVACIAFAL
ncbi:hypothetical protein BC940DRAFT_365992 [Gongronella butleri]|nr:hypothetical protein BC940DRAFT_365992 [Gongronella butleri]